MREKANEYWRAFRMTPLPMQNVLIERVGIVVVHICLMILGSSVLGGIEVTIPGALLLFYLLFHLYLALRVCINGSYTYITGECIVKAKSKKRSRGFRHTKNTEFVRLLVSDDRDLTVYIRKQAEVRDIQEGSMVGLYIPDDAKVYSVNTGLKIEKYFCIVQID